MKGRRSRSLKSVLLFGVVAGLMLPASSKAQDAEFAPTQLAASGVVSGTYFNPLQVGLLSWYQASQPTSFAVGKSPYGVAFDGANIWVANQSSNNVTKLRASDGVVLGTFAVGSGPSGVAFDGAN